jgi:hypothetical protein
VTRAIRVVTTTVQQHIPSLLRCLRLLRTLKLPLKLILSLVSCFRYGACSYALIRYFLVKAYIRKSNVLFAMREYTKAMEAAQEVGGVPEPDAYMYS